MNKKILATLLTSAFGLLGINQASAENLMQILTEAKSNDPVFLSAKASYEAGKENLAQAKSQLLPQISAGANVTRTKIDYTYKNGITPKTNYSNTSHGMNIGLRQAIFNRTTSTAYDQAQIQYRNVTIQFDSAKQDLLNRTVQAYFDALLAKDNLDFASAQKSAIYEQLQQAKRNFEVGLSTITDTHEAQARYDLIVAQEISAKNNLEVKMKALTQLTGRHVKTLSPLKPKALFVAPKPVTVDEWIDLAEKNALLIDARKNQLEIAGLDVQKSRAGHLPTLDLVANADYTRDAKISGLDADTKSANVALQLNIPIFQGGLVNSKVRESIANKDKASQDLENARRDTTQKIRQYYSGVHSGLAQIKAYEQSVISSEVSLKSTRLGLEVGVRTSVDVLNAQQQLYNAKRDLAQAKYTYLVNLINLKATAGIVEEKDIQDINLLLN